MTSLRSYARLFKRAFEAAPKCNRSVVTSRGSVMTSRGSLMTSRGLPHTPRLLSTSTHSCVLRRCDTPVHAAQQQCAYKKSKANTKGGKGKAGKKDQMSQLNAKLLENFMPEHVDMIELNGRMANEIGALSRTLVAINVSSSPAVLATVFVRIGVEKMPVTDLCDILVEHGKPIILDCSVYPEVKDKILEAVNKETAYEAVVHGNDSIKLLSPKLTNELRKRLVSQAKSQTNLTIESIRQIRNDAHNTALRAAGYGKDVQKRTADNVHEVFLHHKAEVDKVFRAKERSLQEEFNL